MQARAIQHKSAAIASYSQVIHLLIEKPQGNGAPAEHFLVVPPGLSMLASESGRVPRITSLSPVQPPEACIVEPIYQGAQLLLLMLSLAGCRPAVNGLMAPRFALLREKDEVRLPGDDHVLHVTLFQRPRIGPPRDEVLGQLCPVCRSPFVVGTTVYVCACGATLHCEGEERPASERLECLHLSAACPCCNRPVVLTEGHSYVPEEY